MKLQNLTVIFIIIIIPIILIISLYITTGLKTIKYQSLYDEGLLNATHDAIYAFEINTANDKLSQNPEIKRSIIKASINMFERSLCNTCGISAYNAKDIEEYIPAIVFGMYDGFYMYAPSVRYNGTTKEYNHNLKNYVYYSEKLDDNGTTIIYSLDNYVVISGVFNGKYQTKEGYLIDLTVADKNGEKYKGTTINKETIDGTENADAINYYKEAYEFTEWFNGNIGNNIKYLYINSDNDPEDENSLFVQHKRKIIKNKIESVLNSSITSYSERTWNKVYKMPKLTVEDWEKVYSNISMITFFQGKSIGLTKYNGYCVLNSTNNKEYVNPNLMYFIDDEGYYHDIRCTKCIEAIHLTGYKVGDFSKRKVQTTDGEGKTTTNYIYDHNELACYYCVNSQINSYESIQNYVSETEEVKTAYWTSLARERYNTKKLIQVNNNEYKITFLNEGQPYYETSIREGKTINVPENPTKEGYTFIGWDMEIPEKMPNNDLTINAKWEINEYTITFRDEENVYETIRVKYGDMISLPSAPTKSGYYFINWNLPYSTMPSQDITVDAIWGEATAEINGKGYATLMAAINNIGEERNTVKLLKNVTENINIDTAKTGTIDFNGHTVTGKIENSSNNITIKNGTLNGRIINNGNIKISEGTINSNGNAAIYNYGNAEITGGNINAVSGYEMYGNAIVNQGELTIKGGIISSNNLRYETIANRGKLEILNGTIKSDYRGAIDNYNGSLTIKGGTISSMGSGYATIRYGNIEITGGNINASNGEAIYNGSGGELIINGGIIENNSYTHYTIYNSTGSSFTQSGGTIINKSDSSKTIGNG